MNNVPNKNEKVLKETLAGFNLDDVKVTSRAQTFQNDPPTFVSFWKTCPHSSVT